MIQVTLYVGQILRVPDDFFTIQAAIDAANDYDVVLVADGIYTGDGNRDIDFLGKAIKVQSENGPQNCIIDCNGTQAEPHCGFYFVNSEDTYSILEGFTITNGYTREGGSGILCEQSSPTITDCIISDNYSFGRGRGGAISIFQSICRINNCTITNNKGDRGIGIYCYQSNPTLTKCTSSGNSRSGMVNEDSNPTLTNCTFSGNSSKYSGGMYNDRSNPTLTNCTFSRNSAERYGGGMCNFDSNPTLTNCTFNGNFSGLGGGMFNQNSNPTLTNCIFTGNSAETGGGIYNYLSKIKLTNCTFSGNSAGWDGGGMYNDESSPTLTNCTFSSNEAHGFFDAFATPSGRGGGIYNYHSSPTLNNCTFSRNSARQGGGMYNRYESSPILINCILWGNMPEEIYVSSGTPAITYSNIQGSWPGEGNIDADPCFVSPGYWADINDTNIIVEPTDLNAVWVDGDYHLLPDSPCIDAATDANVYTDIEGNPRPFDFPGVDNNGELPDFDMGAYEAVADQAELMLLPRTINRSSRQRKILAWPQTKKTANEHFCFLRQGTIDECCK
jgi:parallel beta-helix repeat protein